jgi:hypothetical protein
MLVSEFRPVTGFSPARQVLINDLVGEKHLLNAISLNSAALNLNRCVALV